LLQQGEKAQSVLLAALLLFAHKAQHTRNPAHILTLSFHPNEQRFLFREFSFGFDHLAFQPPQLVNNGVSIHLEHGSPRACANQSKNARPGSERAFFEPKILGEDLGRYSVVSARL